MNQLTRKLAFSGVAVALASVTAYIRFLKLPMGGTITMFSMLFICLVGYWFGIAWGMAAGVAFGLVQFIIDPFFLSIPQFVCDYILAFASLGLAGVAKLKPLKSFKYNLQAGYIIGVIFRWLFAVISGVAFFSSYAAEAGFDNAFLYSAAYNGIYVAVEAALTLIIISIPPVTRAITRVTATAEG